MTTYSNPFRYRASEQQRDLRSFLRAFGPGALRLLPEAMWDRLVVLRSAAGAGKTSLMRVFTAESVATLLEAPDSFKDLADELTRLNVLDATGAAFLGVYLNLDHNYRSLVDVGQSAGASHRLFFRLLDVRIMVAVVKAALVLVGRRFPEDAAAFQLKVVHPDPSTEQAAQHFGGFRGDEIYRTCHAADRDVLAKLDSLLPVDWNQQGIGHGDLYSLRFLSSAEILIDGESLRVRPLIMLDDGHRLHSEQRMALLERLADRTLTVARWYAERHEALSKQERMDQIGNSGRDYEVVDLESIARGDQARGGPTRFKAGQFENVLVDIANRRAYRPLVHSTERQEEFFELLELEEDELLAERGDEVMQALRERVGKLAGTNPRYDLWLSEATRMTGYDAALRWRELEVLIRRDYDRRQSEMFAEPLGEAEVAERSSSGIREAASLALAQEFDLPYYAGRDRIAKLGSFNVEQFLGLCGDLFAEMLAEITLQRRPRIQAKAQHRIALRASQAFWREVARRVPDGPTVQRFVAAIVNIAHQENARPTVPYPPGVTGTALLMEDIQRLSDPQKRARIPGAEALFTALANAVAYNVISVEHDRSSKNKQVMVIYLNRLLCPRFGLPLGRGGYREKRLEVMARWMLDPIERAFLNDLPEQLSF